MDQTKDGQENRPDLQETVCGERKEGIDTEVNRDPAEAEVDRKPVAKWKQVSSTPLSTLREQLISLQSQYESIINEEKSKLKALEEDLKRLGG